MEIQASERKKYGPDRNYDKAATITLMTADVVVLSSDIFG
jgi:hypothetical protein